MPFHFLETKEQLRELVDFLISRKTEITIQIEGNRASYTSRIIKAEYGDTLSKVGKGNGLIIDKLTPNTGNALLKLSPRLGIQFQLRDNFFEFDAKYVGESTQQPHIGLIVSFPESVRLEDRRRYDRKPGEIPHFLYAFLRLPKGKAKSVTFKLKIIDCSVGGVGMLVTRKNFEVLEMVKNGDELKDLELYARRAMIRVSGTVRHKTRLEKPKYKGSYVIGIEFDRCLEEIDLP